MNPTASRHFAVDRDTDYGRIGDDGMAEPFHHQCNLLAKRCRWRNHGRKPGIFLSAQLVEGSGEIHANGCATGPRTLSKNGRVIDYGLGFGSLSAILEASGEHASTNWMPK
jgi:hypothetical protein